jgi:hypothetical protein
MNAARAFRRSLPLVSGGDLEDLLAILKLAAPRSLRLNRERHSI